MMMQSKWLALLLVAASLTISQANEDKKHWESVYLTLMETASPSEEPTVPMEFVAQELAKWRNLSESQKKEFLGGRHAKKLDHLSGLNELSVSCDYQHLQDRALLERKYDSSHVNLHPFIKLTNLMVKNNCYQDYKYKSTMLFDSDMDKIRYLAWYYATDDTQPDPDTGDSLNRLDHLSSFEDQDQKLNNVAIRFARYLKLFYHKIESKYFASPREHAEKIKYEVERILGEICPRITVPDLGRTQKSYATSSDYSTPPSPEIVPADGQENQDYHGLMMEVAGQLDGQRTQPSALDDLYKYKWVCQRQHSRQLVAKVQKYFEDMFNDRQSEDRQIADWRNLNPKDLMAMREILFAQGYLPKLRMGHQYDLLNGLYLALRDNLLPPKSMLQSDKHIFGVLVELREVSPYKCLSRHLSERLALQSTYDQSYVVLHSYIASLNRLQFDLCNQKLRQLISSAILRDAAQLAKLEGLRSLIERSTTNNCHEHEGPSTISVQPPLHERVESNAFARGAADFLYLSSASKIARKQVSRKFEELLDDTCREMRGTAVITSQIEMHDALVQNHLAAPMNEATKRALSYARICKFYKDQNYRIAEILDQLGSAPKRHPKHLASSSWLNCLNPEVND